ncbi:hypothetical protein GCM10022243_37910 [Saccharothrix violaceirubra]|uniref:KAP-like P-loop domain-containing protein n=1 Tax=Saccharothrix violaceirubra TaxID=413306 RepID=A0A7W7T494_9PSEU|nr:hypothetical protein [Saccharothrix violaceirubra]MBB4966295.1 hypothetical protein [Saccharothrix violaceirubra]
MTRHQARVSSELIEALWKVLDEDEFDEEIDRLKLNPADVVTKVSRTPSVVEQAYELSAPVATADADVERHRRDKPEWWPLDWQPTKVERRSLIVAPAAFLGWIGLLAVFGGSMPDLVFVGVTALVLAICYVCAMIGLPTEFVDGIRWAVRLAFLTADGVGERWDLRQKLRDEVVRPELRKWLSSQTTPSFDVVLELRNADSLSLPAGEGPLVETPAVQACEREVNRRLPGAVGLAGTRGVGKSTIIRNALDNKFTHERRQPMLGVLTSAPVRYDARDFVLHLHACVCRAVLDLLADRDDRSGSETRRLWKREYARRLTRARIARVLGNVLRWAVRTLFALGFAGLAWGRTGDVRVVVREATAFAADLVPNVRAGLSAGDLRVVAALLTLWFALRAAWSLWLFTGWPLLAWLVSSLRRRLKRTPGPRRHGPPIEALHKVAEQHLRTIRFLQTHTSGWSGKVSAPIGTEAGWSKSLAKTEQPWTHPEVVDRLRDFLALVVDVLVDGHGVLSGVTIAIDEVDKIGDPEEAQRFLNEIKGVFGVRHCLFLVSMSDDALTAFERRGIPARDAFDSAFTTMIDVRPFTLDESRDWLARRALGIPEPFVWLCHCLSGGLPRDLGRTAIALHDAHKRQKGPWHLADAARLLVRRDLDLKIRAFTHTARQVARDTAETTGRLRDLLESLRQAASADVDDLLPIAEAMRRGADGDPTPITELSAEAACYLLFCQTVVDLFGQEVDQESGTGAVAIGIADARRWMADETTLAWNHLVGLRTGGR